MSTLFRKPPKYNASLQISDLPESQRGLAEAKYLALLEAELGGASKVRGAYCEYVAIRSLSAEAPWNPPAAEDINVIEKWEKATKRASRIVFDEMKITDNDAFFELHVWNSRTF